MVLPTQTGTNPIAAASPSVHHVTNSMMGSQTMNAMVASPGVIMPEGIGRVAQRST